MIYIDRDKLHIGMRTVKSSVSVGLCVLLFKLLDRGSPMLAGLAAIFALREDWKRSAHFGIRRVGGNAIAGGLAIALIAIKSSLGLDFTADFFGTIIFFHHFDYNLERPYDVRCHRRRLGYLPGCLLQYRKRSNHFLCRSTGIGYADRIRHCIERELHPPYFQKPSGRLTVTMNAKEAVIPKSFGITASFVYLLFWE